MGQGTILDPDRNAVFVVPALVVSIFVFAYSVRFGQVSILAFYAFWFTVVLFAPRVVLRRPGPILLILALPFAFALSTLWSDVPSTTLRSAIQYGTTVFCGLVAARITSVPNLALGGAVGGMVVLLYSAANGGYSYDFIDGSYAFTGAFSSKNQLGYFATLTLIFSLALIWVFRSAHWLLPVAAGTACLALVMLWMSNSATSILTAAIALVAISVVRLLTVLSARQRRAAVLLVLSSAIAAGIGLNAAGAFDAVLGAFGKDSTLTGRTYLWNQATLIGSENPVLGLGYDAFWTLGRPEAEDLWREFYITARTGFHFHNVLFEAYVGMGLLGLALVGGLCIALIALPIAAVLRPGEAGLGAVMICSGLSLLFLMRGFAEVDFVTPYTIGSFLVPYVLLKLADRNAAVGSVGRFAGARRRAAPNTISGTTI